MEKLADAANQSFHEGLIKPNRPPQKAHNPQDKRNVRETKRDACAICTNMGAEERAKTHTSDRHYWTEKDLDVLGRYLHQFPPKSGQRDPKQVHGEQAQCQNQQPSRNKKLVELSLRPQPPEQCSDKLERSEGQGKKIPIVLVGKEGKLGENQVQVLPPGTIPRAIQANPWDFPLATPSLVKAVAAAPLGLRHPLAEADEGADPR